MRDESEIVAMRDRLYRREVGHSPGEMNDVALGVLQWVCDPSRSDREVLDLAETDLAEGTTLPDALEFLADLDINWHEVDVYLDCLSAADRKTLGKVARTIGRKCPASELAATG